VFNRAAPNFYRALQYKGLTFGIPYTASSTVAFQRDDILKEVGIKSINTWDELKQVLPKLQAKNSNFTLQWFLSDTVYSDVNMFMWQHGADDYDATLTKSGYDSPECIAGFKEYAELYTKYKIPKEAPVFQSFVNGELAMVLQSPGFYQNLQVNGVWLRCLVLITQERLIILVLQEHLQRLVFSNHLKRRAKVGNLLSGSQMKKLKSKLLLK